MPQFPAALNARGRTARGAARAAGTALLLFATGALAPPALTAQNPNFALNTGWLEMSAQERPVTRAIYFAVLRGDDPSPLLPESDEETGTRGAPSPPGERDSVRPAPRRGTGAPVSAQAVRGDSTRPGVAGGSGAPPRPPAVSAS